MSQPSYNIAMGSPFTIHYSPFQRRGYEQDMGKKRIYLETQVKGEITDLC